MLLEVFFKCKNTKKSDKVTDLSFKTFLIRHFITL